MMSNNLTLHIAGNRQHASHLPAWHGGWNELVKLYQEHCFKLPVTRDEFEKMPDKKRKELKDVGGVVPAVLHDGSRKDSAVIGRDFVSIDIDHAPLDFMALFCGRWHFNAIIHTTASNTAQQPRYRVLIPLRERLTPQRYAAVANKVIDHLGLRVGEEVDEVSLRLSQLMYWPACCKDEQCTLKIHETGHFFSDGDLPDVAVRPTTTEAEEPLSLVRTEATHGTFDHSQPSAPRKSRHRNVPKPKTTEEYFQGIRIARERFVRATPKPQQSFLWKGFPDDLPQKTQFTEVEETEVSATPASGEWVGEEVF